LLQPVHLFMPFPLSHINLNYPELSWSTGTVVAAWKGMQHVSA
jgi:hypothetical protein